MDLTPSLIPAEVLLRAKAVADVFLQIHLHLSGLPLSVRPLLEPGYPLRLLGPAKWNGKPSMVNGSVALTIKLLTKKSRVLLSAIISLSPRLVLAIQRGRSDYLPLESLSPISVVIEFVDTTVTPAFAASLVVPNESPRPAPLTFTLPSSLLIPTSTLFPYFLLAIGLPHFTRVNFGWVEVRRKSTVPPLILSRLSLLLLVAPFDATHPTNLAILSTVLPVLSTLLKFLETMMPESPRVGTLSRDIVLAPLRATLPRRIDEVLAGLTST